MKGLYLNAIIWRIGSLLGVPTQHETTRNTQPHDARLGACEKSLAAAAIVVLVVAIGFRAGAQPAAAALNPIVIENSLPGTPQEDWQPGGSVPTIRGFTSDVSVNKGEAITFYIQTPDAADVVYDLVVYRLGYYQGLGAREVARFTGVSVDQPQCLTTPTPSLDPDTDAKEFPFLIDCGNWIPSWTWTTPPDLVSGLFLAKVQRRDTRISCGIFFVVRDDSGTSDILLQTADTTWQAYNYGAAYQGGSIPPERAMDGHSVYDAVNRRAYKVSTLRPHLSAVTNVVPPYAQEINENTVGQVFRYGEEYSLIRFLEANGFDVSYTTGKDSDRRGELIRNHRLFMTSGHDEYWSLRQMQHVQAARDAGVNLAFFSGNTAYWKIRWEDDYKTMVVFKEVHGKKLDPLAGVSTGLFRDSEFGPPAYDGYWPENAVLGLLTSMPIHVDFSLDVPEPDGKLRFWRNTGLATLAAGEVVTFNDLLGYEIDGDVDNGFRPPGLFHLSTTDVVDRPASGFEQGRASVLHHMSLYRAASGALVFHAGTMRLQRALAGYYNLAPSPADPRLQQAIVNLFADMNVQPATLEAGLTPASASTDFTPPTAHVLFPQHGGRANIQDTVFVSGTATDVDGRVAAVEVSTDGGLTWHPARGRESWSYAFTPCDQGIYEIVARAVDDSGNIGEATAKRTLSATPSLSRDFIANGQFDCGFDELRLLFTTNWIARGWFQRAESGRTVVITQGGLVPGVSLQRIVAAASGDGIGQDLTLVPGQQYMLTARVFVEEGAAVVRIGRPTDVADVRVSVLPSGRWETVKTTYTPTEADCTILLCSDGGPASFKVDDVLITAQAQSPVNLPPTITGISPQMINEDEATGPITFLVSDPDSSVDALNINPSTSDAALVPAGNIVIRGSGSARTVTVTPAPNQSGAARITLTVEDGQGGTESTSFTLIVHPVNDSPTISGISPQGIVENGTTPPIAFTIDDVDSAVNSLTVVAATSNSTLVPVGNIVIGGTGANRTVTVKPVSRRSGTAQITLTVSDSKGGKSSTSFVLTVTAADDPPWISGIADLTINEDGTAGPLAFLVIDAATPLNNLMIAATSSNPSLVPTANVVVAGSGFIRNVTVKPAANRFGSAQITLTVTDSSGGKASSAFNLNVNAVNDAPTISGIGTQTINEDGTAGPISFTLADVETSVNTLTVTRTTSNAALIPVGNILIEGAGANRSVTVKPVANKSGSALITLTVADGSGGTASTSFTVQVNAVNDAPTISAINAQSIFENGTAGPLAFTIADVDSSLTSMILSVTTSNASLVPTSAVSFGGSGANRTITVRPTRSRTGFADLTIKVTDSGGQSSTTTFRVNVNKRL